MNKLTKKELRSMFWRSFALQGAFNYERMQNLGYCYSMLPAIKKLYNKKENQAKAIERHLEIFNTTTVVVPAILGITAAMEEENANNPEFDESSISAVKTALMGPLAGIGDSLFWGTFRIIAAGVGVSLSKEGNIFGPLLFLLLYNIPALALRIFGLKYGYQVGVNSLDRIQREGLMDKIMSMATTVGLFVVGGMVATMLSITTPLKFNLNGAEVILQDILDKIIPNMLPLTFAFVIYYMLKRKVSVTKLTIGTIVAGIVLHAIGLL
ncbi:PTS system mannose/fructose/sorbose family transporter subunit IID [Clostridioides difficile]|uniref:PTS system mannose/fructose/sorbose transporter subunit IID n=2 Tax=Clostridioides difficile TaxID=1496 RepID=A0AAX3H072_CLODI|nr:PTS system mannose/fructose/sorbose family transporter subunit IID [Clostridioides difficile]AXU69700.1 PTS system transporter subunit IID [Clostridioides difficile]AXU91832.1 PTS system transporter subunit IID [Clostridioides difficile]EFH06120.1 PTS system, mannose/fructose/sorbose family, IID component [Clostridioides difficile NAP08]EFH15141.1 PTS system, mannose/fructose/sorbose family, IID component [Clostridioides difficile NAP07]EII6765819.1 PTS system mannose/fructose/sorbose famil